MTLLRNWEDAINDGNTDNLVVDIDEVIGLLRKFQEKSGEMLPLENGGGIGPMPTIQKISVFLDRWSATEAIACIKSGNILEFNIAGGGGSSAKSACMDAAKVLREAAQRFELLASENYPYNQDVHARINAMEDLSKCPQCGGDADRGIDNCIPPSAYMCSKCCAKEEAEKAVIPPAGFTLVYEGLRQDGDMRWSHFDQRWTLVYSENMSKRIEDFDFPCARRSSK